MKRATLIPIIPIVASIAIGTPAVRTLAADEAIVETKLPMETQLAQTGKPPRAKTTVLLKQEDLEGLPGFVVQVVLVEGPPGWVGGRHYHPGHLFGFMLEGAYVLNFEDLTARTIRAGDAFYETPNTVMRSRNASATEWVRKLDFQILRKGQPAAVSVK